MVANDWAIRSVRDRTPHVVVVGGGIVGLSVAWYLLARQVEVTVVDRAEVGAGASWGNAGYIAPSLTAPLPHPAVLRYGLSALCSRSSPVRLRPADLVAQRRFLLGFARNCSHRRWSAGFRALSDLRSGAQNAFDELHQGGVQVALRDVPILATFTAARQSEGLLHTITEAVGHGQDFDVEVITGDRARELEPLLSDRVELGIRLLGQRFLDPPAFVQALAAAVTARGGLIRTGVEVTELHRMSDGTVRILAAQDDLAADAVVVANGAWLSRLTADHGVRMPVQAGRGYSFEVDSDPRPRQPLYFAAARSASTPTPSGLRITGLLDLCPPDTPLPQGRIDVIERGVASGLRGVDWSTRRNVWVGSRPLTTDGLPMIGPTRTPGIFAAGGHGMWGLTLGPITGKLLAGCMLGDALPTEAAAVAPTRPVRVRARSLRC